MSDKLKALGGGLAIPMGAPMSIAQIKAQKAAEEANAQGQAQPDGQPAATQPPVPTQVKPDHPEAHAEPAEGDKKKYARAMYDSVENSESLQFKAGDLAEVLTMDGEWWWVDLKGQTGYVPRDFFKLEEDDHGVKKAAPPPPKAEVKAAAPIVPPKADEEVLAPGVVVGIALYDYAPPSDIENSIGLKKGEKVYLDTNVLPIEEGGEWLFAVSKTKQGYIPRNYVKLLGK